MSALAVYEDQNWSAREEAARLSRENGNRDLPLRRHGCVSEGLKDVVTDDPPSDPLPTLSLDLGEALELRPRRFRS